MSSAAVPLGRVNVDTDQIVPKQFLKLVERTGFGKHLFHNWRRLADGSPDPSFVLNDPLYEGSRILLAGDNFGCGSSREHAVWALLDYGFDAVIAPSFADIFYSNCFKNGLLPVALGRGQVDALLAASSPAAPPPGGRPPEVSVDLEAQTVSAACIGTARFEIAADRRAALLGGMDEIDLTLGQYGAAISAFESGPGAPPSAPRSRPR